VCLLSAMQALQSTTAVPAVPVLFSTNCRLALEAGAPIVPVFAFGQTPHYRFWRPFIDWPRQLVPRGAMGRQVSAVVHASRGLPAGKRTIPCTGPVCRCAPSFICTCLICSCCWLLFLLQHRAAHRLRAYAGLGLAGHCDAPPGGLPLPAC
jgi:hypothetical protein